MQLVLVDGPETTPVSLEEMKAHLRIDYDDADDEILGFLAAATRRLDGANGLLGRCLCTQTWRVTLDSFDNEVSVPLPPLQSVDEISYIGADGVTVTLDPSEYQVFGISGDGRIRPGFGKSWPTVRKIPEAVSITFTAGYPDIAGSPPVPTIPEPLCTAIMLHASTLFENREGFMEGDVRKLPQGYDDLIADYRIPSF